MDVVTRNLSKSIDAQTEDERRLAALGYKQEVKRIFGTFTNFGLTASMISILLGVIPLYTYELQSGGSAVMIWSWVIVGFFTVGLVQSLGEICCAFPTMGALYYWSFVLGGNEWGPFASWVSGWCNLLGQIAGVASGGYAGATIFAQIIGLSTGVKVSNKEILGLYALMLVIAGVVNTMAETLLTALCYVSVFWQIAGTIVIVVWTLVSAPTLKSAEWVFTSYNNDTGFDSIGYVALVGTLAAASVFTGYDTAAHVAEETVNSHESTPKAMLYSVYNAFLLGLLLIIGMNFAIQGDLGSSPEDDDAGAYTHIWLDSVGRKPTIFFSCIPLFAVECSNCANLTSAARMVYSFARDSALPFSNVWYHISPRFGGPVRAIWLSLLIAFLMGVPGLGNAAVLNALFSLTATGLYASYAIPIILRVTVARKVFEQKEYSLGKYSIPLGIVSVLWCFLMVIILCLPNVSPVTVLNINYSPLMLGAILVYAVAMWYISARHWFKGAIKNTKVQEEFERMSDSLSEDDRQKTSATVRPSADI